MYAYTDERFWTNYRDVMQGMVERSRNRASLVMWSVGNEILFMGNTRYDAQLPKKLGDMGRFVKSIDPIHPITYEADLDPDNAYDVIGLHYPREMPAVFDYPNGADWLNQELVTEAGGGMLGTRSSTFYWDRKKPLFIGEYLWVPFGDYSPGTVYYGDEAYLDRVKYLDLAKQRAWFDQTIAYRRAGVSGLGPWGAEEKEFFRHVAAFIRNRDTRFFAGEAASLRFDVFNDSPRPLKLELQLVRDKTKKVAAQTLTLPPAGRREVSLTFNAPRTDRTLPLKLDSVLLANGKEVHRVAHTLKVEPRRAWTAPAGVRILAFDPAKRWPNSVDSLATLANVDARRTILLVAPRVLAVTKTASSFDTSAFLAFVRRGGRAVVLEQTTLEPLDLDLKLDEHAATMTFPLRATHPILKGIAPDDLKFWRGDHYVTRRAVQRPSAMGARAVTVAGGPGALDHAPIVEMPVGTGHVVVIQNLVGEKLQSEPAAGRLLQNTLNYLATLPFPSPNKTRVLSDDAAFLERLVDIGLVFESSPGVQAPSRCKVFPLVVLNGGAGSTARLNRALMSYVKAGGTLLWHAPDDAALDALNKALNTRLRVENVPSGARVLLREAPLLSGIAREDITYTTTPRDWNRQITPLTSADRAFLPQNTATLQRWAAAEGKVNEGTIVGEGAARAVQMSNRSSMSFSFANETAGLYPLTLTASGGGESGVLENGTNGEVFPLLEIRINGNLSGTLRLNTGERRDYSTLLALPAGPCTLQIAFAEATRGRTATLETVALGALAQYPTGSQVMLLPGSLLSMPVGQGRVILNGVRWDTTGANRIKGNRYASGLLANLGGRFSAPELGTGLSDLPLTRFRLVGQSGYSDLSSALITLRNNGLVEAEFTCAVAGTYRLNLRGYSSAASGVYSQVKVLLDGREIRTVELNSPTSKVFDAGTLDISPGRHRLGLAFINDALGNNGEDRNLFLEGVRLSQ
jgi:hypothetical protein